MNRIEILENLVVNNSNDNFSRYALALEYKKQGRVIDAERVFADLLTLAPDYVATYFHFADLLVAQSKQSQAMEVYNKGIEMAEKLGDDHTAKELRNARFNLELEMDD